MYLKESLSFYYLAFVLMCFGPGLDSWYSLERFIEAVLTCTHHLCFEPNQEQDQNFSTEFIIFAAGLDRSILYILSSFFERTKERKNNAEHTNDE